ncbi:MAG: hypothetical protein IKZ86_04260 [Spirochaetaceae bacterium]|nr:hypothetical protein [Spirochaetaceae bacterium]
MIDLNKIQNEEDKILISDAIKLADSGFLRASYIMSFIACIESIKRRFIELGKKDSNIGRITTEIRNKEERHEAVEKFVIDKAKELMLIDDIEKAKLEYFWGMRSVYSHPYEQNPSYLDCQHIINSIFEIVLSKPLLIRTGVLSSIIKRITDEESYIRNDNCEIDNFVKELFIRVDPTCFSYFWYKIIESIENTPVEEHKSICYLRQKQICKSLLRNFGYNTIFKDDTEIENFIYQHKPATVLFFSNCEVFRILNNRLQDIIFRILIEQGKNKRLNKLYNEKLLSNANINELKTYISTKTSHELVNFSSTLTIEKVINELKTYVWDRQNAVYPILKSEEFYESLSLCTVDLQITLGRNILQASTSAFSIGDFLSELTDNTFGEKYPVNVKKGIVFECFINERKRIRAKLDNLCCVEKIFSSIKTTERNSILTDLRCLIDNAIEKSDDTWDEITNDSIFYDIKNKILSLTINVV